MQKPLGAYPVVIAIFCGVAFEGLSELTPLVSAAAAQTAVERDPSSQISECVLAVFRDQENARKADRERLIRETRGTPLYVFEEMARMMPPPPSAAEVEYSRHQELLRIEELGRLRVSAASH